MPPNITTRPRRASNTSGFPLRAGGIDAAAGCDQLDPSNSHVSPRFRPGDVAPPNSTVFPRLMSYAIPGLSRAGGLEAGVCCVHAFPSNTQVSAQCPVAEVPPNITI